MNSYNSIFDKKYHGEHWYENHVMSVTFHNKMYSLPLSMSQENDIMKHIFLALFDYTGVTDMTVTDMTVTDMTTITTYQWFTQHLT